MNVDLTNFTPFIWILAALLGLVIVIVVIRFFWQHILKFLLHGCLSLLGLLALLALLYYIFHLF